MNFNLDILNKVQLLKLLVNKDIPKKTLTNLKAMHKTNIMDYIVKKKYLPKKSKLLELLTDSQKKKLEKINNPKPYCKLGPVPKGFRIGSMPECFKLKKIGYYGLNKIDSKTLLALIEGNKPKESKLELIKKMSSIRGLIDRKLQIIKTQNLSKEETEKLREEYIKLKEELLYLNEKLQKIT